MKSESIPIISGKARGRDELSDLQHPHSDTFGVHQLGKYSGHLTAKINLAIALGVLGNTEGTSSIVQTLQRVGFRGAIVATTDIQMLLVAAEARKCPKLQQLSGEPLSLQNVGVFEAIQAEVVGYIVDSIVEKSLAEQVSDNNVKQPLVIPRHVSDRYNVSEIIPFDPMAQAAPMTQAA